MYKQRFLRRSFLIITFCSLFDASLSAQTTSSIAGQITVTDVRILDLTGTYTLHGEGFELHLAITQFTDGALAAAGFVRTGESDWEPEIGPIPMSGGFWIEGEKRLNFALAGGINESFDDGTSDTGRNADIFVELDGELEGGAIFDTEIDIQRVEFNPPHHPEEPEIDDVDWRQEFSPVNPARGLVVSDALLFDIISPGTVQSTRTVTLPSGTLNAVAFQTIYYNGKSSISVDAGFPLKLTINGHVKSGPFVVKKAKIEFPYGRFKVKPEKIIISPTSAL